jgi:hypothetical protein
MLLKEPKMKDKRCNEEESLYGAGGPATLYTSELLWMGAS